MEQDMHENEEKNGRLGFVMRRLMTGAILCCLSGAVLVVVGGKSGSKGRLLEQQVVMAEKQVGGSTSTGSTALVGYPADGLDRNVDMGYGPTAEWKAFPIEGLNVGYPKLQSSFESERFEPQKSLPPIGFNPAGKEGWDGKLPMEPVRENEVNHPLKLDPFERLPALEQANISKATAEEAAKVAKEAYSGGGKENAKEAAPVPAGETPAATPKSPSQAVVSKGLNQLAGLQRTAAALTSEAKAAVDALNQAELRVAQEHTHETQQAQQRQQQQQQQQPESPAAAAEAGSAESLAHKSDRRDVEQAALEDAKREVDEALRRLAAKHQSLRQAPREREQAPAAAEKNAIQKKIARAQQAIYDRFDREYRAAFGKTHQQLTQRPGDATHRGTQKLWIGVKDPDDEYEEDAEGERNDQGDEPRQESREDVMRYIQKYNKPPEPNPMASNPNYIPTSGPLERATIVRDVPARNWPLVGQIGHTHSWPFLRYDKDLVIQGEDPVVAPASCRDDPISVDCTGGFGGGVKSTGGPMNTRVGWRHDNELGARPEIDGPVRVEPELQDAWHRYYGNAGGDRMDSAISAGLAPLASPRDSIIDDTSSGDWPGYAASDLKDGGQAAAEGGAQKLWDARSETAGAAQWSPQPSLSQRPLLTRLRRVDRRRARLEPFSPFAAQN